MDTTALLPPDQPNGLLADLRWTLDPVALAEAAGIDTLGATWRAVLALATPVHLDAGTSGHNLSARDRSQAYFCYNRVANRPRDVDQPRPDYVRSTNWTPMELTDDARVAA